MWGTCVDRRLMKTAAAPRAALRLRASSASERCCSSTFFPLRTFALAGALPAAADAVVGHLGLQGEPAARAQRIDDVGLVRGGLRVAAAARTERDDDRRRGERVEPVHVPDQGTQSRCTARCSAWRAWSSRCRRPGASTAGSGGVPGQLRHAGRWPSRWSARRRRTSWSTRRWSRPRSRCRRGRRSSRSGTRTSSGARRAISSAPARRRWRSAMLSFVSVRWLLPLAAAPLYLTYRSYKVYLGRIDDEQRHVREMADLHLATIEALALAIDAKDQTSQSHIRRVQLYAGGAGARARACARTRSRASRRRRCCTTSASWRCPSTSCRSPGR